jgi:hypothetical protein
MGGRSGWHWFGEDVEGIPVVSSDEQGTMIVPDGEGEGTIMVPVVGEVPVEGGEASAGFGSALSSSAAIAVSLGKSTTAFCRSGSSVACNVSWCSRSVACTARSGWRSMETELSVPVDS